MGKRKSYRKPLLKIKERFKCENCGEKVFEIKKYVKNKTLCGKCYFELKQPTRYKSDELKIQKKGRKKDGLL